MLGEGFLVGRRVGRREGRFVGEKVGKFVLGEVVGDSVMAEKGIQFGNALHLSVTDVKEALFDMEPP